MSDLVVGHRYVCPSCRQLVRLARDGMLRRHRSSEHRDGTLYVAVCPGTGERPVP